MNAYMNQLIPHSGEHSHQSRQLREGSRPDVILTRAAEGVVKEHPSSAPRQNIAPQERRLQDYLREVTRAGAISESTASLARKAWDELKGLMAGNLQVPDAGPGPDGQLLYTWDKEEHHFELEIFPGGSGEFFYMNRKTDTVWEHDYTIGKLVPAGVKSKLRIFGLYDA